MEMVRPHFEGDKELWAWVENVVDQAMKDYAAQFTSALKDSTNERIYQQIKALEKDPKGFLKLNSILKPSRSEGLLETEQYTETITVLC